MSDVRRWHVVYTWPNAEAKLAKQIEQKPGHGNVFLPVKEEIHQWSDRKKRINVPLFKSYVFVQVNDDEYHRIKKLSGFAHYIRFSKQAAAVPESDIERIRLTLASGYEVETTQTSLVVGDQVEINAGCLKGYQGVLMAHEDDKKVAIEVQGLEQSLLITVPADLLTLKSSTPEACAS